MNEPTKLISAEEWGRQILNEETLNIWNVDVIAKKIIAKKIQLNALEFAVEQCRVTRMARMPDFHVEKVILSQIEELKKGKVEE